MGRLSILNLEVKEEEVLPPKREGWGTPEERYRHLCMLVLLCRYSYYCYSVSLITDDQYDRLEKLILAIEDKHREMIHWRSPTVTVGSDQEEDYPASVRMVWRTHKSSGLLDSLSQGIEMTVERAERDFGV